MVCRNSSVPARAPSRLAPPSANYSPAFSARDREFAHLYFGEGMDPADIARSLKISVKTVYSKKHKIQARLESALAGATDRTADESGAHAAVALGAGEDGAVAA